MNNRITPLLDYGLALALLIVVAVVITQPEKSPDTDGLIEKATGSDGKKVSRSERMIVHLWSLDCLPCKRDAQVLQRFYRKHSDYQIIGLNIDGLERKKDVNSWVNDLTLDYQIAITNDDESELKTPVTLVYQATERMPLKLKNPLTYRRLLDATGKDR